MTIVRCLRKPALVSVPPLLLIALLVQLAGCGTPTASSQPAENASRPSAAGPDRDADGWTIFRPDADSRIIYVSSIAGDDAVAKVYSPADEIIGKDPFHPAGQVKAFKTISAAMKNARASQPDWVLLRRGDDWQENIGEIPSGRDRDNPFLLSAYGDRPDRPVLRLDKAVVLPLRGFHDVAFVGLEFYCDVKDPKSPRFNPGARGSLVNVYVAKGGSGRRLLLEDCCLRYMPATVHSADDGRLEDIAFRRCLILDNYSRMGHAQGIYAQGASILLEENIFDHNGWLIQGKDNQQRDGGATMFNHNTYFSNCHDTVFRGNMFLRASSMGNKWTANSGPGSARNLTMDNNLYIEGEIGIGAGGNKPGPLRFKNVTITNNVFMHIGRAMPTSRELGWDISIADWDGGLVAGNLLLHQNTDKVNGVYGIHICSARDKGKYNGTGVHCRNISIRDNIMYGLRTSYGGILITEGQCLSGITISDNLIQFPGLQSVLISAQGSLTGMAFSNNTYFSGIAPGKWFSAGEDKKSNADFAAWVAATGDTGSAARQVGFRDPARTVEAYNASLGGKATLEDFIEQARKQSRANWRKEYTAAAVNAYIRAGFQQLPAGAK